MSGRGILVALLVAVLSVTSVAAAAVAVRRGRALDDAQEKLVRLEQLLERRSEDGTGDASDEEQDGPAGGAPGLDDLLGGPLEDLLPDDLLGADGLGGLLDGGQGSAGAACAMSSAGRMEVDDRDGTRQYADVLRAVEVLRELDFRREVEPTYLSLDELSDRVEELVEEDLAEAPVELERRRLVAFGVLEPDVDLAALLVDLYAAQVAGFYDSETEEMVVGTNDPSRPLSPLDQMVLAHELTHALTDQVHDLDELIDSPAAADRTDADAAEVIDSDEDLAKLAVVEGDASIVGNQYLLSAIEPMDLLSLLADPRASGGQLPDGLPYALEQELQFPYVDGADYVCDLLQSGGWEAVDAAYDDPPASTAEVLFDERRGELRPEAPPQLSAPNSDYQVLGDDTLGAARLSWLFAAPGDDESAALDQPRDRARGWDGDAVRVWTDGDRTAVGLVVGDRGADPSLCASLSSWYDAAISDDEVAASSAERRTWEGGRQSADLRCDDDGVALAIAPTLDAAARMHR